MLLNAGDEYMLDKSLIMSIWLVDFDVVGLGRCMVRSSRSLLMDDMDECGGGFALTGLKVRGCDDTFNSGLGILNRVFDDKLLTLTDL